VTDSAPVTTVRLRAIFGRPLADERVRETVLAAAASLAEREGVPIIGISASDSAVETTLACDRIAALGFAVELRRATNAWYEGKYESGPLWAEASEG